jgi:predicted ATPase
MDHILIEGYKSIKSACVVLKPINILIGANGAGKSNFISFFEFLNRLYDQKLKEYVNLRGGTDKFLFNGIKTTSAIHCRISFENGINEYSFVLKNGEDGFVFTIENLWYQNDSLNISDFGSEAKVIREDSLRAKYTRKYLNSLKKYHFHDTGRNSPFSQPCHVDSDCHFLYERGENIASFLLNIKQTDNIIYYRIIKMIQSIAPFFSDFYFQPNQEGYLRLFWQDKFSSTVYNANDLSDGTLRFIALTTLFMQPHVPASIIIDEPELGLHPQAIAKLAGMVKSVSAKGTQVILATQSVDLMNYFEPEDIVTVDQKNRESIFTRLNSQTLSVWLEEYTVGDLWQRNIITTGQPK